MKILTIGSIFLILAAYNLSANDSSETSQNTQNKYFLK